MEKVKLETFKRPAHRLGHAFTPPHEGTIAQGAFHLLWHASLAALHTLGLVLRVTLQSRIGRKILLGLVAAVIVVGGISTLIH